MHGLSGHVAGPPAHAWCSGWRDVHIGVRDASVRKCWISKPAKKIAVTTLLRRLLKLDAETIAGVTVSGGEPFSQAPALLELFSALHEARPHWNIQVYSGYTLEQLRASGDKRAELLERIDILVDGLFMRDIPQTHAFAGSGNQVIHYLTPRALALKPEMDSVELSQMNYGIGNGSFDMLIGVVQDQPRKAILEYLHETQNP